MPGGSIPFSTDPPKNGTVMTPEKNLELATFGAGGCFWGGVEEAFRRVPGVVDTAVGFMGGTAENPTYPEVCTGRTGHAEVVQVTYDPEKVSYRMLLDTFWDAHDPTTPEPAGGADIGTQYRSVIFYHTPRAGSGGPGVEGGDGTLGKVPPPPSSPRSSRGGDVLAGRGVPPAVLREARGGGQCQTVW